MTTLQTAKKYEELLGGTAAPAPYDYALLFKADGFFARMRARRRFKLLKGVDARLRQMLRPEERVYYLTSGTTVTVAEHFFVGWAAHYINLRALVFTTERVLLLQIDSRKRAHGLVSQLPYSALREVKATWNGYCQIKLVGGQTYNFLSVPKADRKYLADFLGDIVKANAAMPAGAKAGLEHLCPHCFTMVPAHPLACPVCHGAFKSARKASLLSLIFPGFGDWYLGHRGFAIMEMFGSLFMWLVLIISPLIAEPDPEYGEPDAVYWIIAFVVVALAHTIDAVMTRHFALKGHHPDGKSPASH